MSAALKNLISLCERPVEGLDGEPFVPEHIYLVVPSNTLPSGTHKRLAGRAGPLGRICTVKEAEDMPDVKYSVVASYSREEVITFCKKVLAS